MKRGFSIGEVLISSFLLMVGIVAATALIVQDMREAFDARDTIIASQLAQEGVELVRNVRDTNAAKTIYCRGKSCTQLPYDQILTTENKTYYVSANYDASGEFTLKHGEDHFVLRVNRATGEYEHDGTGDPTRFQRRIIIDHDTNNAGPADNTVTVTSLVSWDGNLPPQNNIDEECVTSEKCAFAKDDLTGWLITE